MTDTTLSIAELRRLHGRSTAAWVGDGTLEIGQSHWLAFSGARHPDYNLALCHGPLGGAHLPSCLQAVSDLRQPAIIAVAGETKSNVGALTDANWIRVGTAPLMVISTEVGFADDAARVLEPAELPIARAIVEQTYGLTPELAEVAMTVDADRVSNRDVWGIYEGDVMVSCLAAVQVDTTMVIWSMATSYDHRRRGYGLRLLRSTLAGSRRNGCITGLLHASAEGEQLYLAAGYQVVERWDLWSRARWVLAQH